MENMDSSVWKRVKATFFFSRLLHCHPFEWDQDQKWPRVVRSNWALRHWYLNVSLALLNICFIQFRAVQVQLNPESSVIESIYVLNMAFWYAECNMIQIAYIGKYSAIERFIRNHMLLLSDIWDTKGKQLSNLL